MEQKEEKVAQIAGDAKGASRKFVFYVLVWVVILWGMSFFITLTRGFSLGSAKFGAVTALLSGLAFVGVIYVIWLQRQELVLQRTELKLQRDAMKRQRELGRMQYEELTIKREESAAQMRLYSEQLRALEIANEISRTVHADALPPDFVFEAAPACRLNEWKRTVKNLGGPIHNLRITFDNKYIDAKECPTSLGYGQSAFIHLMASWGSIFSGGFILVFDYLDENGKSGRQRFETRMNTKEMVIKPASGE